MIIDKNILTIIKKRHIIRTRGEKKKKSFIAKIVEIVLIFIFIIGIVTLPFIPKLYNIFKDICLLILKFCKQEIVNRIQRK